MEYIGMIASVPGVVAVVNLLKKLGLSSKLALVAAVVVGIALNVGNYYLGGEGAYQAAATGLIIGLGAAGVYDLGSRPEVVNTFTAAKVDNRAMTDAVNSALRDAANRSAS